MTVFEQAKQLAAPRVVDVVHKRAAAVALRRQGYTYEKIGEKVGITKQTAHAMVVAALEERRRELNESVDDVRDMEVVRLDKMTAFLFKRLDDPKHDDPERTVTAILKIMERRASLLGLDAPKDYRFTPGAVAAPTGGDIDVSRLTVDQLRELDELRARYDALALAAAPPALPPGELIAVVEPKVG
jgi:hypothetical protein